MKKNAELAPKTSAVPAVGLDTLCQNAIQLIQYARHTAARQINTVQLMTFYSIGRWIIEGQQHGERRAEYGRQIIKNLSDVLTERFGKGFSVDTLENARKFYLNYQDRISDTVFRKFAEEKSDAVFRFLEEEPPFRLSFSHYLILCRIRNNDERRFYEIEAYKGNWSVRTLQRQYGSSLYERLLLGAERKNILALAEKGQSVENADDLKKDPYVLEFLGLQDKPEYAESELESRIIGHLQEFLMEMGKGFTFVGRQVRFSFDEDHFRVDLVLYNRLLKCFVLIDLKVGKLKHQDIGQMQMYVNYYDRYEKTDDENPTVGILLCSDKNDSMVEMTLPKDANIYAFSHSALREGWDNPNVFQICTLKQSGSDVRKRQEVGRGLRLCVDQDGERMDTNALGDDVHNVNVLTVIASESYDRFAKGLQNELAEAVADRPQAVAPELFKGRVLRDADGNEQIVDGETAQAIYFDMIKNGYVDKRGALTDTYYRDRANGEVKVAEEAADCAESVIAIVDSIYDARRMQPENARDINVELRVDQEKLAMPEFKELWKRISPKSAYAVDFNTDELTKKSIDALNRKLRVAKIYFKVESGSLTEITSKEDLKSGGAFIRDASAVYDAGRRIAVNGRVKYDLVGKLVEETGLTRRAIVEILAGIEKTVFDQFRENPEEFIIKARTLINEEKATVIIQHIAYNLLNDRYETDIFTDPTIKGRLGVNAMKTRKHLYDHIVYDSSNEQKFAEALDTSGEVAVYVKLPDGFYISTPVGRYNPDWAIAFYEGNVKHVYFVAETKGSMSSMQLRLIEESKIHCAREHFKAISSDSVIYDVVDSYQSLLDKVMR